MSTDPKHTTNHDELEDPDSFGTWGVGICSVFILIATVAIGCGIFYSAQETEAFDKNVNIIYTQRNMVRDAQHAVLQESAHWVSKQDAETGETTSRLVIPIDQAMDIIAGNSQ